jgi:hypothetical protein
MPIILRLDVMMPRRKAPSNVLTFDRLPNRAQDALKRA